MQGRQDRLLNLRLADEIDADAFAAKRRELRDREAALKLRAEVADRSHAETADLAARAFELSQALAEKCPVLRERGGAVFAENAAPRSGRSSPLSQEQGSV